MTAETASYLSTARTTFGQCAATIVDRAAQNGLDLTPVEEIRVRALGTAKDYVRWALALGELYFATPAEAFSGRVEGLSESVRFLQMWTAANALFARDEI